ncbi:MAG: hypothetical protein DRP47_01985 [Candidatus Zixiibacteriota bacterium]|nr:MAG: hypothetical protein DRP47_01985 [candidate division Zixibacteria bacterium]
MSEKDKKKNSSDRISEKDRFKFIGFEVFPGKPKDLFKSDAEKNKLIDGVRKKRQSGDILRDECTLMEERVSMLDRITLTVASLVIFITLFVPWYSVYNEIEETTKEPVSSPVDSIALVTATDSLMLDSLAMTEITSDSATLLAETATEEEPPVVAEEGGESTGDERSGVAVASKSTGEEVIHGYVAKKKFHKEYVRKSGLGAIFAIGSIGGSVFSSGFILILTAIVLIIYTLLCIGLPVYTLYGIYGTKGDSDKKAIKLKNILRYNWLPLCLFVLVFFLSFFGANYGFDATASFSSLGDVYNVGVFLDSLSWGIIVSLGAFVLVAAKGVEI